MTMRRKTILLIALLCASSSLSASPSDVRGINLLSRNWKNDSTAIVTAAAHGINHVQLSHRIGMNLCDIRDGENLGLIKRLSDLAHGCGIGEVCLWDHALYDTDYYPRGFMYPGTGLIDLDNPEFWEWVRDDYRSMMELCPEIDGLVLTFIESGARVEEQISDMSVPERLARVIGTVSSVVCDEFGKKLWLRTFAYNEAEYENIRDCFGMIEWKEGMGLMMKDVPHDFFLPHPDNGMIGIFGHPTIVEFDTCGEYNGQSVILNTLPSLYHDRMMRMSKKNDVAGFVARTSRCGDNEITGTPAEINIAMLDMAVTEPAWSADRAVDEYLNARYGKRAARHLKKAFSASRDIIDGTMYIMGLSTSHHSEMKFDAPSTYSRHVSGRWTGSDTVHLGHGIDRDFHWWKDLVNTLAPLSCKNLDEKRAQEISHVTEAGFVTMTEEMNEEYLRYIRAWTEDCIREAGRGFRQVKRCRNRISPEDYTMLSDIYERSMMCLRLRQSAAICWWGQRIWARGEEFRTPALLKEIKKASSDLRESLETYESYDRPYPIGTWDFLSDADAAREILSSSAAVFGGSH